MTFSSNKRLLGLLLLVPAILLIPLVAMQFTTEVRWTASDFIVMGGLLLGTVLASEWVLRTFPKKRSRFVLLALILAGLLLVWAELAVGIFGTPFAGS